MCTGVRGSDCIGAAVIGEKCDEKKDSDDNDNVNGGGGCWAINRRAAIGVCGEEWESRNGDKQGRRTIKSLLLVGCCFYFCALLVVIVVLRSKQNC
jgi:hypothetical protein